MNKQKIFFLGAMAVFLFCTQVPLAQTADFETNNFAAMGLRKIGDLKPTFYWVTEERDDGEPRTKDLRDLDGRVLARVSAKFKRSIDLEGTGKLLDGRVLNYYGRVGGEIRYRECGPEAPFGYGINDYPLVPFRSVAVDPKVVPMGSRVYIPQAIGAVLPDGTLHDGYFQAVDIGDAIQNHRIDVFTGIGDQSRIFERVGFSNMKPTAVFIVTD